MATYGNSIFELSEVEDEINRTVRGGMIDDRASALLASIRKKLISTGAHPDPELFID